MLLICETCHKHWKLPRGHIRQATCPKCRHRTRSRAARTREAVRRIVREGAGCVEPAGPTVTADELIRRMGEADAKAARALELAQTIAARFTRGGT
jgi:hypothetical protein